MKRTQVLLTVWLASAIAGAGACSSDTAPTGTAASDPPGFPVSLALSAGEEERLKAWEEREKERIKLEQERSKRAYDSLKVEWARDKGRYERDPSPVLFCDPLQYAATVKVVGPEGADLDFGPHKLRIPRGALTRYIVVTAEAPVSLAVQATFSPHGTAFVRLREPKLTLSYKHCTRPTSFRERVAYIDRRRNVLEWPKSADRTFDGLVDAWLKHFSHYAVAE